VAAPTPTEDFQELRRRVRAAGLLERRPWAAGRLIAGVGLALVGGWVAFVLVGPSWWQLAVAAFLGLVFAQLGFLGHDAAHHQLCKSGRANALLGLLLGNTLIGLGRGWWTDKHNAHHAHPNDLARDPDVRAGALVFCSDQADRPSSVARFVTARQASLVLPMLLFEGLHLHVSSLLAVRDRRTGRVRWVELALLGGHVLGYAAVVFWVLPLWQALSFIAVHQAVLGLSLGLAFAPNHKGMPLLTREESRRLGHVRTQALTSRNVRAGWCIDLALGGLNAQIEHHLFPNMPRTNLRRARPVVRRFCAERGVPYLETGLVRSYVLALGHLHAVGRELREGVAVTPG
jgi:fatty acid desaturase